MLSRLSSQSGWRMSSPHLVNETTQMWAEVHAEQAEKRRLRKEVNLSILRATTIPFEYRNGGDVVMLRHKAYPAIDFWPSTNKWLIGAKPGMGDANALVELLRRRALK